METSSLLAFIQPVIIALLLVLYINFKFSVSTWKFIIRAFLFGLLAIIPLVLLDLIAGSFDIDNLRNLKRIGFYAFVVVGFGSELGKFVLLRYVFLRLKTFSGPLDGIIYALFISLGFSLLALPLFAHVFFAGEMGTLFLLTYTFAGLVFAVVMGFFTGMGKYRKNRLIDSFTGLAAASFFHGFFYFANLTSDKTILLLFGIGVVLIALLLGVKAINIKDQEERSGTK